MLERAEGKGSARAGAAGRGSYPAAPRMAERQPEDNLRRQMLLIGRWTHEPPERSDRLMRR